MERNQRQAEQKNADLTDEDLTFAEGEEDKLLGRLQTRLGKSKEQLRREIQQAKFVQPRSTSCKRWEYPLRWDLSLHRFSMFKRLFSDGNREVTLTISLP
jgi:uncharacterized protein YjbJ (UPF0337 family)